MIQRETRCKLYRNDVDSRTDPEYTTKLSKDCIAASHDNLYDATVTPYPKFEPKIQGV